MKRIFIIVFVWATLFSHTNYATNNDMVEFVEPEDIEVQDYVTFYDLNGKDLSYDANTYGDLYLAFEDLNLYYEEAKEEIGSLERNIEDKNLEIERLEEEVDRLEEENKGLNNRIYNSENDNTFVYFIGFIIVAVIIYNLYNYLKTKPQNQ